MYQLSMLQKISILQMLVCTCYETEYIKEKLNRHVEIRTEKTNAFLLQAKEEKKKTFNVSGEIKQEALQLCREEMKRKQLVDGPSAGGKKGAKGKTALADPTPQQMNAAIEEIHLRSSLGIELIVEDYVFDISGDDGSSTLDAMHEDLESEAMGRKRSIRQLGKGQVGKEKQRKEQLHMKEEYDEATKYLNHLFTNSLIQNYSEKQLKETIKYGIASHHRGLIEDKKYCTVLLFKVYKLLNTMELSSKDLRASREHENMLSEYFIRTEPLGQDRFYRIYWKFRGDSRLFVESRVFGDVSQKEKGNKCANNLFYRKPSGYTSTWRLYGSRTEIYTLISCLDERGKREKELKLNLLSSLNVSEDNVLAYIQKNALQQHGSEYIGRHVNRVFHKVWCEV